MVYSTPRLNCDSQIYISCKLYIHPFNNYNSYLYYVQIISQIKIVSSTPPHWVKCFYLIMYLPSLLYYLQICVLFISVIQLHCYYLAILLYQVRMWASARQRPCLSCFPLEQCLTHLDTNLYSFINKWMNVFMLSNVPKLQYRSHTSYNPIV